MAIPVVAGALASGLGQLAGNYITGKSAEEAAKLQADALNRGIALQGQIYGETKQGYQPYLQAGERNLGDLESAVQGYTKPTYGFTLKDFNLSNWQDPGFNFRLDQAKKAIEASTASKGMGLSSGMLKALQTRSQDMASQEYEKSYDRWLKDAQLRSGLAKDQYSRDIDFANKNIENLAGITKLGTDALGNLAGAGANYGKNLGTMFSDIGDAQAQNAIAQGKSWSNTANLMGTGLSSLLKDYFANAGSTNPTTDALALTASNLA